MVCVYMGNLDTGLPVSENNPKQVWKLIGTELKLLSDLPVGQ